jgi:hypothetical protein
MRQRGLNLSGSEQGQVVRFCEHGNDPSGSTECANFLCRQDIVSLSVRTLQHGVSFLVSQSSS